MALSVQKVLQNISHSLGGGDLSIEIDKFQVLNEAGEYMFSMYPWKWSQGRSALLNFRGTVSGLTGTWTAATRTFTQVGGFTTYSFLTGDEIEIKEGTGVVSGVYKIESRTSNDAIVLEDDSLSAVDLSTGDISWQMFPETIELPHDLRDIVSIQSSSQATILHFVLTGLDEIARRRGASAITMSPALYYAAVVYSGTPPVPLLEIWPSPSSNQNGVLRLFYRARWQQLYSDSDMVNIPEWMESLYVWIARAYARGYEREDEASLHARLQEIVQSPIFEATKLSDGATQPSFNRPRGGGATVHRRRRSSEISYLINRVGPPI
jgi:hypothetical protein